MFKDLKLNRDNIENVLNIYAKNNYKLYTVSKEIKNSTLSRYHLTLDDKILFIDLFYNSKGGTTLMVNNGKERDEKFKIATFIANNPLCILADKDENNRSMLFKDISAENFQLIIKLIKEECEHYKSILSENSDTHRSIIKLDGKRSDKVTITYTNNTQSVRVQGKPLLLFNEVVSFFNEIVDEEKVIDNLESNYNQEISKSTVEAQFEEYLPFSHMKHSGKMKKSLLKAVYNLNVTSQEYTCTELTFEVLRALEGHVKLSLLNDYNIRSNSKNGTLTMFSYDSNSLKATLKETEKNKINDVVKIAYYEKAYGYMVVHRHKFFHWDYPDSLGIDETIQIDDIKFAKKIIVDTLTLIDEYYMV